MAGTDKSHILSATMYFVDYSQKPEFDEAWKNGYQNDMYQ